MRKFICLAMALVMCTSMFTACGCTRRMDHKAESIATEATSIMPTVTTTVPTTTVPAATTVPHTHATEPATNHTGSTMPGATEHTGSTHTTTMP